MGGKCLGVMNKGWVHCIISAPTGVEDTLYSSIPRAWVCQRSNIVLLNGRLLAVSPLCCCVRCLVRCHGALRCHKVVLEIATFHISLFFSNVTCPKGMMSWVPAPQPCLHKTNSEVPGALGFRRDRNAARQHQCGHVFTGIMVWLASLGSWSWWVSSVLR